MRPLLRILAVAGHLAALQLVAGVACWLAAPLPALALALALGWLLALAWDIRDERLAGCLPRPLLALALALAEAPALVAWCPQGSWLGRDWWLWLLSAAPYVLIGAGVLVARIRPPGRAEDGPAVHVGIR